MGSTVDGAVTPPKLEGTTDFLHQLHDDFSPNYSSGWNPFDTLFSIFFGINDLMSALHIQTSRPAVLDEIFAVYSTLIGQVGALFLILECIPLTHREAL